MQKQNIRELKDKEGNIDIELKVIYDQLPVKELNDKKTGKPYKIKTVTVANADSEKGDGGPTAFLDLKDEQIDQVKFKDIIKVVNGYTKLVRDQFIINNVNKIELIKREEWQKDE